MLFNATYILCSKKIGNEKIEGSPLLWKQHGVYVWKHFPRHDKHHFCRYSQTWVNDHLWIATTCLQRPPFWKSQFEMLLLKWSLTNYHLSTTTITFGVVVERKTNFNLLFYKYDITVHYKSMKLLNS